MINTGEQEAYILVDRFIETGMPFAMYRILGGEGYPFDGTIQQ